MQRLRTESRSDRKERANRKGNAKLKNGGRGDVSRPFNRCIKLPNLRKWEEGQVKWSRFFFFFLGQSFRVRAKLKVARTGEKSLQEAVVSGGRVRDEGENGKKSKGPSSGGGHPASSSEGGGGSTGSRERLGRPGSPRRSAGEEARRAGGGGGGGPRPSDEPGF